MEREDNYIQRIVPCQSTLEQRAAPVQQQTNSSSYTANFIQGPPPLISDKPQVLLIQDPSSIPGATAAAAAAAVGTSKRRSSYPSSNMSMAGIPGVYFGYQIQPEEQQQMIAHSPPPAPATSSTGQLQLQQSMVTLSDCSSEPTTPLKEAIIVKEESSPTRSQTIVQSPAAVEFQPSLAPPALIPTPTPANTSPKSESSYLTQQIMKSTSTLFNFIQLQVLSSITNSKGTAAKKDPNIDGDGFRVVPNFGSDEETNNNQNTGYKTQALTSYEQNFLHDLHIASPTIPHYTNSNSRSRTPPLHMHHSPPMDLHDHYGLGGSDPFGDGKRRRQKKTREEKLAYLRQYARNRRARETPEQREARLADLRARQRARKANETPDQRKVRLEKDRLKTGRYRAKKRQDDVDRPGVFGGSIASGPYILSD